MLMTEAMIIRGRDLLGVPVIDELRLCYLAEPSLLQELASIPQTVDVLLDLKFLAEYIRVYNNISYQCTTFKPKGLKELQICVSK